jgi:hypothetical protein
MNTIFYNLSFNRKVVLLNNYFPDPIYSRLLSLIKTVKWQDSIQPHRQVYGSNDKIINSYIEQHTLEHAEKWAGAPQRLVFCTLWKDTEGLTYKQHTDKGIFSKWRNHIQIYLNDGETIEGMGTRFHQSVLHRKPTIELGYTGNSGYFINHGQTIYHSVSPVPKDKIRHSLYASFEPL